MSGKFTVYRQSNAQVCGPDFTASATLDRVFERFSLSYAQLDCFRFQRGFNVGTIKPSHVYSKFSVFYA